MNLMMADQGGNSEVMREYRKGNWTVNEAMVLIEAKKMDDERRTKRNGDQGKPTELRWKWVEDYCWRKGCLRSQNQCNDKWDNLMRDYKKVREYQRRIAERVQGTSTNITQGPSYWDMEKNERKEKNLPSNMLPLVYERLEEVVEKKGDHCAAAVASVSAPIPNIESDHGMDRPITCVQTSLPPLLQSVPIPSAIPLTLPAAPQPPQLPPPIAAPTPPVQPSPVSYAHPIPLVDCDTTSEYSDSPPAKRRKRGGNGEGTSGGTTTTTTSTANNSNEVVSAISKSATIIAEAIQGSDAREERRHRDLVGFHERRLKMEESKAEINKRGIEGLVDAINKLATSNFALASQKNLQSPPK